VDGQLGEHGLGVTGLDEVQQVPVAPHVLDDLYQRIVAQNPVSVVYPPGYHASFEGAFVRAYESVVFGGTPTRDAARAFITEVNAALATT
jgi:hypothetical protein